MERLNTVRSGLPAVTHTDDSEKPKSVRDDTPLYAALICRLEEKTDCPVAVHAYERD